MLAKGTSSIISLPYLLFFLCFLAYFFVINHWALVLFALIFAVLAILGLNFFRDPHRKIGKGVVSSADGIVSFVKKRTGKVTVSVFMNVHNVHVNRAPLAGTIKSMKHRHGGFVPAYKTEAKTNERLVTDLETDIGPVRVVQIAGTVARRIIPYCKKGQELVKGQRIGIIRLGSRVDVTMPLDEVRILVSEGDKVLAGTTTIAKLRKKKKKGKGR